MTGCWISNQSLEGKGVPSVLRSPWNQEDLLEFRHGSKEQLNDAIQFAYETFPKFSKTSAYQRRDWLLSISMELNQRKISFAETIAKEAGKPISDALNEVTRAVSTFQLASEETTRFSNGELVSLDQTPMSKGRSALIRRFARGVVLGITPFNFPLNLVAHKVAPALACGCPIVLKPAPQTPMTAMMLADLCKDCGLPADVLQVCVCEGDVVEGFVSDSRFGLVSFTGSESVGWKLRKLVDKALALELGGNGAVLIDETADIERAVHRCLIGGYAYAGQVCISVQRIYVVKGVYQEFLTSFLQKIPSWKIDDPLLSETKISCMINETAANRAKSWLNEAITEGATILYGGRCENNRFEPTVVTKVPLSCNLYTEELFAPITIVESVSDWKTGIDCINNSRFGLQAGFFTENIQRVFYAYETLEVGGVICNDVPTFRSDTYPYGGVKRSGLGREGVKYAMEEMSERRVLVLPASEPF